MYVSQQLFILTVVIIQKVKQSKRQTGPYSEKAETEAK